MPWSQATPIINKKVRGLCCRPYPLHPRGCPNFKKKDGCPPAAPLLGDFFDLSRPTYVIWNLFDIGKHVRLMSRRHPEWSQRQLYCCLYWQPRARAQLNLEISEFKRSLKKSESAGLEITKCPEAMGLDVTSTMSSALDIDLEWPPLEVAYQIAFAGYRLKSSES